jgi:hypothetical protein
MDQTMINWLVLTLTGAMSWFLKSLWQSDKALADKLNAIELLVAADYVTRSEFNVTNSNINSKLDRILDKLDTKADKP